MKKKDIIMLSVSLVVIVGAVVFMYFMLFPQKAKTVATTANTTNSQTKSITGKVDDETLGKINALKNYVSTNLDNIGRTDPFGPLK